MPPRAVLYVHPLVGLVTVGLGVYAASLGLRSRTRSIAAEELRRRHARIGPWLWALVVTNWLAGLGTMWLRREDVEVAASGHFTLGSVIAALFTAAALVSRRIPTDDRARTIHPLIGATAVVLSGVQVFLGLQLLP
jgi:Protein of unknown function (DUF4079)